MTGYERDDLLPKYRAARKDFPLYLFYFQSVSDASQSRRYISHGQRIYRKMLLVVMMMISMLREMYRRHTYDKSLRSVFPDIYRCISPS